MHVSDDDCNMFCKLDVIWWTLKKCWNFMIFLGPALSAFFCEKFNFSEEAQISHACFWWWFQYVLQVWWNLVNFEKMLKFYYISRGRHCHHFSVKKFNFSEWAQISHACFWWWLQYVLQVWWNLVNFKKMLKFYYISRAGTVTIFLWKI